jgi:hypothetical protein
MSSRILTVLLIGGALARIAVLPLPGTRDVPDWKATSYVASSDFTGIYGRGGSPPEERKLQWEQISVTSEYPPISQAEMAIVGRIYRLFDASFADSALLTGLIKSPGLAAEILLVVLLLTWGRRVLGDGPATWAAAIFWINPSIWLAGPALGYLDAQMAVPATLALLAAVDGRPKLAGFLAAVAVLTKPQAVFMLPALALVLLLRRGRVDLRAASSAVLVALAVAVLAYLPFVVAGTWPSLVRATRRLAEHDLVSGTATNLWWLVTWAAGSAARVGEIGFAAALSRPATMVRISTAVAAGIPNPRTVGTILTLAAWGWAAWRGRRGLSRPGAALLAAWCVLAYFLFSGQVHENHAYLAVPMLGLAAAEVPRLRGVYWAVTAVFFLNMYLFYGLGMTQPPVIGRAWTFVDASVLLSIAYLAVFGWLTRELMRVIPSPSTRAASS